MKRKGKLKVSILSNRAIRPILHHKYTFEVIRHDTLKIMLSKKVIKRCLNNFNKILYKPI